MKKQLKDKFIHEVIEKINREGLEIPPYTMHDGAIIQKGFSYNKSRDEIIRGKILDYDKVNPAFWIKPSESDDIYAVELYFDEPSVNLRKYNNYILKGWTDLHVIVIDFYTLDMMIGLDYFDISNHSTIETSYNLVKYRMIEAASEFSYNGDFVLCPASDYKKVFSRKTCKDCPFISVYGTKKNTKITCWGKTCICKGKDIKYLLNQPIPMTEDFKKDLTNLLSDSSSNFYSEIKDKNASLLDDLKPEYVIDNEIGDFGRCPCCNTKMKLGVGKKDRFKLGVEHLKSCDNNFAYVYCPKCRQVEPLLCPNCKRHFKLLENEKYGRIFLACEGYASSEYREDVGKKCMTSLTLYTDKTCKVKEQEFIKFGSLTNLKNKRDFKKHFKAVEEHRDNARKSQGNK